MNTLVKALSLAALLAPLYVCSVANAEDIDLSPASWAAEERSRLDALNAEFSRDKPMAVGEHGVVTGTTGAPAVYAGLQALRQGGTAADAVVTTALTQVALAAGSWVSYAGIFNLLYYEAETGKVHNLNGSFNTVLGEEQPMSIPRQLATGATEWQPSGRTALVPGFLAAVEATHQRFGKLPFAELFEPALYYATEGLELNSIHASMLERRREVLERLPETRAIFTGQDGSFLVEGDVLRQPKLAATLRRVANEGTGFIYRGDWGEKLVAAVQAEGGKMTMEDLAGYEATWQEPVRTTYGGFEVVGHGLPAQGGVHVIEVLNLAEAADLRSMGHYTESPEALFWLVQMTQMMTMVFLPEPMRKTMFGDLDPTLAGRVGKENAAGLWAKMRDGEFPLTKTPKLEDPAADSKHSDAIVAIDRWGNVAAVVHSINTSAWGDTGIFVDGISIPDSAAFQQALIAETGPGKRLPDPTEPVIVLRDGKPVAALASIGAGLHQKTVTVLLSLLDSGMDIKQAIDAPSHHLPAFQPDGSSEQQVVAGDFSDELLQKVRAMGLAIRVVGKGIESRAPRGYVVGATIGQDGRRRAAGTTLLSGDPQAY